MLRRGGGGGGHGAPQWNEPGGYLFNEKVIAQHEKRRKKDCLIAVRLFRFVSRKTGRTSTTGAWEAVSS